MSPAMHSRASRFERRAHPGAALRQPCSDRRSDVLLGSQACAYLPRVSVEERAARVAAQVVLLPLVLGDESRQLGLLLDDRCARHDDAHGHDVVPHHSLSWSSEQAPRNDSSVVAAVRRMRRAPYRGRRGKPRALQPHRRQQGTPAWASRRYPRRTARGLDAGRRVAARRCRGEARPSSQHGSPAEWQGPLLPGTRARAGRESAHPSRTRCPRGERAPCDYAQSRRC